VTTPSTEAECRAFAAAIRAHHQDSPKFTTDRLATLGITGLSGGANNTVYSCHWNDRACCIKLYRTDDRRRDEREWLALHLLTDRCPGTAPRPLWRDLDPTFPLVAMERIPGESLRDQPLGPRELTALADSFRRLLAITPTNATFPYRSAGATDELLARLDPWLATDNPEPTKVGSNPTPRPSPRRRTSWPQPFAGISIPVPDSALHQVRALARQRLANGDRALILSPAPAIFGRGDPNLANCLWDAYSGRVRLIDLEYAGWDDLAGDLADLIEGPWARHVPDADWLAFASALGLPDPANNPRFIAARYICATF